MINSTLTEQNLDVEVVKKIVELQRKINMFRAPIFKENGVPVMEYWDEFAYSGLSSTDYVYLGYYKDEPTPSPMDGLGEQTNKTNKSQLEVSEVLEMLSKVESSLVEDDLDVEVVKKVVKNRKKINGYKHPIFFENGEPVMNHWNEFRPIGLLNCDYVTSEFYKTGWNEE